MLQTNWKLLLVCVVTTVWLGDQTDVVAQPAAPAANQADEESPLLEEPKTPEELFDATMLMVRLARPQLARRYLEQLMAAKPNSDLLLKLRDKHGPAAFLRLANMTQLRPLSSDLLDLANEAFRRAGADSARIDALIDDLSKTAPQQAVALVALKSAGTIIVPRILARLGDPARADEHDLLTTTLIRLGSPIIPPLLGALDSPNENLKGSVIETLGWTGSLDVAAHLWYPAFAPQQPAGVQAAARRALARIFHASPDEVGKVSSYGVASKLQRVALEHFRQDYNWPVDVDGAVTLWSWRANEQTVGSSKHSPQAASLYVGTRIARQALVLGPDRRDLQSLFVAMTLASARHRVGFNQPLPAGPGSAHDLALSAGAEVVTEALRLSLNNENAASAVAALEVLGQNSSRHQLYSKNAERSPIISALNYPNSHVQFAAANTILQLDPDKPFRGANRVVSILARALNDSGSSGGLVVDANTQRARKMAGLLGELGYESQMAPTGRDGFRLASERMDIELILLEINTMRWGLSQTIANLRADARTAAIPIVVYGEASMKSRVQSLLQRHSLMTYVEHASTAEFLGIQLKPFLDRIQTPKLNAQQRARQMEIAAFWFAHIADGKRTQVFNITSAEQTLVEATGDPKLASDALLALSAIGSQTAQQRFQEVAVSPNFDVELRQTAALQLAFHIQRFGLLLSQDEVAKIMSEWKTAKNASLATALASVVGSLKPNATRVDSRLQGFPLRTVP